MNYMNKVVSSFFKKPLSRPLATGRSAQIAHTKQENRSVVKEAERAVGYPTSFLSLRWILNDEIANVATHIRRLIGTKHPLLNTAKSLLLQNEQATWGLIVLLVSKTAGLKSNFAEIECDRTADILHSQRIIAEVTDIIKTSNLIHKGIININHSDENAEDLNFGNKLALLCGDYLLSISYNEVAKLKNFEVQETIASTLRDLAEAEFIGDRGLQNQPIPSKPCLKQVDLEIPYEFGAKPFQIENVLGNMKAEWTLRTILGGGTLLGKCCQCSLILGNHDKNIQELGYCFGRNLAITWQASLEKKLLMEETFSLVSAPVMFHLEFDPKFYNEIQQMTSDNCNVDYQFIRKVVLNGPAVQKTVEIQEKYKLESLKTLDHFKDSDSKRALINIIKSF